MSFRKTILLRKIISYFATASQLRRYDELAAVNKGSSSHFAFRLLENYFDKLNENPTVVREKPVSTEREIKINYNGQSWMQKV